MKVSCLQENLAKGLSMVGRTVATRSTLPVLTNVMLSTDNGRLKLSATDLEIGINCWIGAKVEEDGAITVPARSFIDLVNSLPSERIDMELVVRTQTLNLKCARYEANLKGIDAHEFPFIPALEEGDGQITLEAAAFRRMIKQVVLAAAADESRPILTGVLAKFEGNKLTLAAADGFRLSVRTAELPVETELASVIIPARGLAELARISTDAEDITLVIPPTRKQALFHAPNVDLVSQLIEGNFPDYQQIIPKSYATRTVVNTNSLLRACKTANIFARDAADIVRLQIVPGGELALGHITIAAASAELGDNVGEIDASIEGDEIEITFNVKYLIDALSVMDSAQVVLETTTSTSPGVLKPVGDADFVHVMMPMYTTGQADQQEKGARVGQELED